MRGAVIASTFTLLIAAVVLAVAAVVRGSFAMAALYLAVAAALAWVIARSIDDPYAHPRNQVTNGRCVHCNHAFGVADIRTGTCQHCGMPIWDRRAA